MTYDVVFKKMTPKESISKRAWCRKEFGKGSFTYDRIDNIVGDLPAGVYISQSKFVVDADLVAPFRNYWWALGEILEDRLYTAVDVYNGDAYGISKYQPYYVQSGIPAGRPFIMVAKIKKRDYVYKFNNSADAMICKLTWMGM